MQRLDNSLPPGKFLSLFCRLLIFFSKSTFSKKKSFMNTIRVSNSVDPDQARRFVGPDLGPNCLQNIIGRLLYKIKVKTIFSNVIFH